MTVTPETLLHEIQDDLCFFLKNGNLMPLAKDIDPNLNIRDIETLLRIHFLLTEEVMDFIKKIHDRLKRIKTTVRNSCIEYSGEARGRINWNDTLRKRVRNEKLLSCEMQEKSFSLPENIVLKKLLLLIDDILNNELKFALEKSYGWVDEWFKNYELKRFLTREVLNNVYLKRVDDKNVVVTNRMLDNASKSRNSLYREAAHLLLKYRRLMNYDLNADDAKELLRNTFIKPGKDAVLFELYWIIKILKGLKQVKFNAIRPGGDGLISSCYDEEGNTINLYHDSSGSMQFYEPVHEVEHVLNEHNNYFGRELRVIKKLDEMLGSNKGSLWGGRPDILIEVVDCDGKLKKIFIGEVKYTNNINYAIKGLKEMMQYVALVRDKKERYIEVVDNLFDSMEKVQGCLYTDDIPKLTIPQNNSIEVVKFGDKSTGFTP